MKKHVIKYYLLLRNAPLLFVKAPKILSFEETINEIVNHKKSFGRFGDGEIRMMMNEGGIGFQRENPALTERLQEVMHANEDKFLIGLPNTFNACNSQRIDSQIFWLGFNMVYAKKFLSKIDINRIYGDTNITRFYMAYKDKSPKTVEAKIKQLKRIWSNQEVLIIEGEHTKLGIGNDFFTNAKGIKRIICPAKDAFSKYDEILNATKAIGKDKLILIALGPTATVLSYDLAKAGVWAVDVGHIDIEYSWFLEGKKDKSSVKGKFVNESSEKLNDAANLFNEVYENTVVQRIV